MAIQLNERDHLIFKLIEEHQLLLEKQIAWLISYEAKPVLIRDRLRKLFYLDYLICQRYKETLPWWTTPTKPLVYALSPATREIVAAKECRLDLNDESVQRHLLEVANLRMLFFMDEKNGLISHFSWATSVGGADSVRQVDARACFSRNGVSYRIGIINQAKEDGDVPVKTLELALADDDVEMLWVVCRDEFEQESLQERLSKHAKAKPFLKRAVAFATHQDLYRTGMVKSKWQNIEGKPANIFVELLKKTKTPGTSFRPQAASA